MEMVLSSRFHKYINFMFTSKDRLLVQMPPGIRNYEVTGWWGSPALRETERAFKAAGYQHPMLDALIAYFDQKDTPLPLIMYNWDGSYELQYFPADSKQPAMICAVASKDVYEMRREAKAMGIWIDPPKESTDPVVIVFETPVI